jgi:tetratricopeptide (TPR) repeat protein
MAIPIEGATVVAQRARIQPLLDNGEIPIPNSTVLADDDLWRCSFMTQVDAEAFAQSLEQVGLNVSRGPDSDVVIIDEIDRTPNPYCEWLEVGCWEKAVIAWLAGAEPRKVVARAGWDPSVGSGLAFGSTDQLELLRVEENVEVFRDRTTGKEVFIGRTTTPVESLYQSASDIILAHLGAAGDEPAQGDAEVQILRAIEMLDRILATSVREWRVPFFQGKGYVAVRRLPLAYAAFTRALELEQGEQTISRELAGVCLALGKFDEARRHAERAVALQPDNHELLANLALAHLMAGDARAAKAAILAAIQRNADDPINRRLHTIIAEVAAGRRPPPRSMDDLSAPTPPKKRPWQFWKR